ncbi:MAG: TolC family protein [bacterium]|jgi:TolC family type I secretion outer membrane protein|nr:TolC family protein [bacterium]
MKLSPFHLCLAFLLLVVTGISHSQESPKLSLAEAVNTAIQHNPELEAVRKDAEAATLGKAEARSYYLPQVKFSSDATKSDSDLFEFDTSSIPEEFQDSFNFGDMGFAGSFFTNKLTLGQLIYDRSVIGQINLAHLQEEAANWQRTGQEQQVAFETVSAYLDILLASEILGVQKQRLQLADKQLQTTQTSFDAGLRIRTDVLRAELSRSSAERDVVSAEIAVKNAQVALNKIMGTSLTSFYTIESGDLPHYDPPQDIITNMQNLDPYFSLAQDNNPAIKISSLLVEQSYENINIARGEFYPRVSIGGSAGFKDSSRPELEDKEWAIQATVEIPIFEGGRRFAKVRRTTKQNEASAKRYEETARTVLTSVEQASLALQEQFRNLEIAVKAERVAQENYERFQNLYQEGLADSLDITQSLTELVVAQTDVVRARYGYLKIYNNLLLATGTIPVTGDAYNTIQWLSIIH